MNAQDLQATILALLNGEGSNAEKLDVLRSVVSHGSSVISSRSGKGLKELPTESDLLRMAQRVDCSIQNFRSKQLEVILNILSGRHTVTVMATSSGKTLIWLLAGYVLSGHFSSKGKCGLTIVLCPLQSLVSEHGKKSQKWGATCTSSDDLQDFKINIPTAVFLYTTAEKLMKNMYFRGLVLEQADRVVCIVRDEAHIWMDDFRPALCEASLMLSQGAPDVTHLAVTATLDVNADIINSVGMPPTSTVIRCSVNRENCYLHVIEAQDKKGECEKDARTILSKVNCVERPQALVFVTTQKDTQTMAAAIQGAIQPGNHNYLSSHEVVFYHAALTIEEKNGIAEKFRSGVARIVVCTSAFGTGLDFSSIRMIFHRTIPTAVSEYLQNIGRGGRDGQPYHCFLFFSYKLIHECANVWMTASHYSQQQLDKKWSHFVEMVKYPMSTLCRRAYLLPMFDSEFQVSSICNQCDNCVRLASGCDMYCDITRAAHILIKVIQESVKYEGDGITISRIRDIILGLKPRMIGREMALNQLDKDHAFRGLGLQAGFSSKDRYLWSMLSSYLMYAIDPPLLTEGISCSVGVGFKSLVRKVRVTPAGASALLMLRDVRLRYPLDLMQLREEEVSRLLSGTKHVIIVTPNSRRCANAGCSETNIHAFGLCRNHYQKLYNKKRKTPTDASSQNPTPSVDSRENTPHELPSRESTPHCEIASSSASKHELKFGLDENDDTFLSQDSQVVVIPSTFKSLSQETQNLTAAAASRSLPASQESCNYSGSESSDDDAETLMSVNDETKRCILKGQFLPGSIDPAAARTEVHTFAPEDAATFSLGWAKVGYTSSCIGRSTKKYKCLGCWHCPDLKCPYKARPQTKNKDNPCCGNTLHHAGNSPRLVLQTCDVRFEYNVNLISRVTTLTVSGVHKHGIPPPNRVGPETLKHLAQIVQDGDARPTAMSLQLSSQTVRDDTGASAGRRLGREIAAAYAQVYGTELGIGGLDDIRRVIGDIPFVRHVQIGNADDGYTNVVFCQLNEQQKLVSSIADAFTQPSVLAPTTACLFCDVTYKFSTYFKMTFMTESNVTGKGITVAFALVTNLTTSAYMRMFYLLFTKNPCIYRRDLEAKVIVMLFDVCLVDFADSQRKGFLEAIAMLHREAFGTSVPFDESPHRSKLKGCKFHWKQSVKHCSHNGHVIPQSLQSEFNDLATQMEQAETIDQFNEAVRTVETKFPGARNWLKWWTNPLHGLLIFPSMRSHHLYEEIEEFYKKPATNNIVEANNRATARFIDYAHLPVVLALRKCFLWAQLEARQVQYITEGILHLGARGGAKIKSRMVATGGAFKPPSREDVRNQEYDGGNRAPVTSFEQLRQTSGASDVGKLPAKKAKVTQVLSDDDHLTMRANIAAHGLAIGTVVEVLNDTSPDRWYMRITDGTVAGELAEPYLVGGQWLKANSRTVAEKPIKNNPVFIKSIINVLSGSK